MRVAPHLGFWRYVSPGAFVAFPRPTAVGQYEEDYSFLRADRGRYSPICTFPREDIPFLQGAMSAFIRETFLPLHGSKGNRPFSQDTISALNELVLSRLRRQRSGHGAYK